MAITLRDLDIKLFADCADKVQILEIAKQPWVKGFTTNPSLMKAAGVTDYVSYAQELVAAAPDRHISFEVFSDDIPEMIAQARVISTWGPHVYVKLPVTTTRGEPLFQAVHGLSRDGIQINLTAVFTSEQVVSGIQALSGGAPACVSIFAGRLADAGIDHRSIMRDAVSACTADDQCRDYLGVDEGGLQRDRGEPDQVPYHHCTGSRAQEASISWNQYSIGIVTRRSQSIPRGCRGGWTNAAGCGSACSRMIFDGRCGLGNERNLSSLVDNPGPSFANVCWCARTSEHKPYRNPSEL